MRFRPRYSLRVLFTVVTAFGLWLGWQLHIVKQRSWWIQSIRERGGSVSPWYENMEALDPAFSRSVPWYRLLLGDRKIAWIMFYPDCPPEDKEQIQDAFPEVPIIDFQGGDVSVIPIVG